MAQTVTSPAPPPRSRNRPELPDRFKWNVSDIFESWEAWDAAYKQLEADLRGMHSHGLRASPIYLDRIAHGIDNPRPSVREAGGVLHGADGPGQSVAHRAMSLAIERARAGGIGNSPP